MSQEKIEYWINVRDDLPVQNNTPVNVANYRRQWLPYLAYLDDKGQWRNYHTKFPLPEVEWWMQYIPPFPDFDVPEAEYHEEIMRLRKIVGDLEKQIQTMRGIRG